MQATASPAIAGRQKFAAHLVGAEPRQRRRRHIGLHPDRHRHAAAMDRAEFFRHHQRVAVVEPLAAELDGLVEAEKAEVAELLEQLMGGELLRRFGYAICMRWPGKSLTLKGVRAAQNATITMLGVAQPLAWQQNEQELTITIPDALQNEQARPCEYAWAVRIPLPAKGDAK